MKITSAHCRIFLKDLNVPVYGTRFTLALVKKRLDEAGCWIRTTLREVIPWRAAGGGRAVRD